MRSGKSKQIYYQEGIKKVIKDIMLKYGLGTNGFTNEFHLTNNSNVLEPFKKILKIWKALLSVL